MDELLKVLRSKSYVVVMRKTFTSIITRQSLGRIGIMANGALNVVNHLLKIPGVVSKALVLKLIHQRFHPAVDMFQQPVNSQKNLIMIKLRIVKLKLLRNHVNHQKKRHHRHHHPQNRNRQTVRRNVKNKN